MTTIRTACWSPWSVCVLAVVLGLVATRQSRAGIKEYLEQLATKVTTQSKPPSTLAQWQARRTILRKQYLKLIGLDPLPKKTPLNASFVGAPVELDHCTFQRVVFESRPKVYVAAHLYIPKNVTFPVPAVIHVPGHSRRDAYRAHPRTYAENGFVAIALPMVGEEGKRGTGWGKCGEYGPHVGHFNWYNTGYTATGPTVWDGIRAVDYLLTLEDKNGTKMVAPDKIGMAGLSGGSARTLWTTMADPRIACAVVSCGFTAVENYDRPGGINNTCDVHLFYNCFGLSYGELYSLIAPRPLLVQHGTKDRLYPNPQPVVDYLKAIYKLHSASDHFEFATYDQGHSYGGGVWAHENEWMDKWLRNGDSPLQKYDRFTTTLTCFPNGEPSDMAHTERLFTPPTPCWNIRNKADFQQFKNKLMQAMRTEIIHTAFQKLDARLVSVKTDDRGKYRVQQKHLELGGGRLVHNGYLFCQPGKARPTIILLANKTIDPEAAAKLYTRNYLGAGINLFCLEVTSIGSNPWSDAGPYLFDRFAQLVGHTRASLQVDDIRAAVATLARENEVAANLIFLWGKGNLAVPAIYAAVADPTIAGVVLENAPDHHVGITPVKASHCETAIFHILRYADIPQVAGLLFPRLVIMTGKEGPKFSWTKTLYERLGKNTHFSEGNKTVEDVLAHIVCEAGAKSP